MATFDELKARYMEDGSRTETGSLGGSHTTAATMPARSGSQVVPLVMGSTYFAALKATLATLNGPGSFFYTASWWFNKDFSLDGATASAKFVDLLKDKAKNGMDVRVLGWVMPPEMLMDPKLKLAAGMFPIMAQYLRINDDTIAAVSALRKEPKLAPNVALNTICHPAGAVHYKFVICGDATKTVCYTGGLDFGPSRHLPAWHDVQAEVTGPVVQDCFEAFRAMWNEVQARPIVSLTALSATADSRLSSMPSLPARTVAASSPARMHVQSLRTVPVMKFGSGTGYPKNKPISFAPAGLFEIQPVWKKAVKAAQKYVYIEDQAFFSTEVFEWVNDYVRSGPAARAVLVTRPDPADEETPGTTKMNKFLQFAITQHLINGLSDADIDSRIAFIWRKAGAVHSKTTLVDDVWSIVGSANAMRRSLYTDLEHSVAWMDEDGKSIAAYRDQLWGEHLKRSFVNVDAAIRGWFDLPYRGTPGAADPFLSSLPVERVDIRPAALPKVTLSPDDKVIGDYIMDADSRQEWGPALYAWIIKKFPMLGAP